jgi:hypothetical protein
MTTSDTCEHGVVLGRPCCDCDPVVIRLRPSAAAPTAEALRIALELDVRGDHGDTGARAAWRHLGELLPDDPFADVVSLIDELVELRRRHPRSSPASSNPSQPIDAAAEARGDELLEAIKAKIELRTAETLRRSAESPTPAALEHTSS